MRELSDKARIEETLEATLKVADDKLISEVKKLKILIAEDDPSASLILNLFLNEFAWEIVHAVNGVDAVEAFRNNPDIDLILMDLKMPGLNGYEAARQIRELNGNIIIIAQTANVIAGEREKAMNAGFDDYITKPIRREALIMAIHRFFRHNLTLHSHQFRNT